MFSKTIISFAAAVALSTSVMAAPTVKRTSYTPMSFNNYGGYSSMSNFDDFYGADNFSGFHNTVTVDQSQEVVCHDQTVEIIQQQLAVLREYAKKIVTEQICEVEVQTVVFTQFVSGFHDFSSDLLRQSGRSVGFDSSITSHIGSIHDSSGNLVSNNLGFEGSSIGSSLVSPSGNNWNSGSSPASVGSAFSLAQSAGGLS
ncbi:hypothetical protein K439DRAFT_1367446 [Ramaria rubella]|nr:hypothetical protein K439DRAFT_1367446 [Ramaria rubella]